MPIHSGQKEIIRTMLLQPLLETLSDDFADRTDEYRPTIEDVIWSCFSKDLTCFSEKIASRTPEVRGAFLSLRKLHQGTYDLRSTFGSLSPAIDELRLVIYEFALEHLHRHHPQYHASHAELPSTQHLTGMEKIRRLMHQYLTLTARGSLERFKLAHEIQVEKRLLALPVRYPRTFNVFEDSGYAPGDFSHLNLSHLSFVPSRGEGCDPVFKGLALPHCNLEGSIFDGIRGYGFDFNHSNLRGCMLFGLSDDLVLDDANIEGLYVGEGWVPPKSSATRDLVCRTRDEYASFCLEHFGAPLAAAAPTPVLSGGSSTTPVLHQLQGVSVSESVSVTVPTSSLVSAPPQHQADPEVELESMRQRIQQLEARLAALSPQAPAETAPSHCVIL